MYITTAIWGGLNGYISVAIIARVFFCWVFNNSTRDVWLQTHGLRDAECSNVQTTPSPWSFWQKIWNTSPQNSTVELQSTTFRRTHLLETLSVHVAQKWYIITCVSCDQIMFVLNLSLVSSHGEDVLLREHKAAFHAPVVEDTFHFTSDDMWNTISKHVKT
jgi:hypothetical protein